MDPLYAALTADASPGAALNASLASAQNADALLKAQPPLVVLVALQQPLGQRRHLTKVEHLEAVLR